MRIAASTMQVFRRLCKIVRWLCFAGISLFILGAILAAWIWQTTPPTAGLNAWVRSEDAHYGVPYAALSAVSPWMARALVTIEDERCYQHHGIDITCLLRAAWDDVHTGSMREGGNTLTAQLAKNAHLNDFDHTIPLKLKDLVLAVKVENTHNTKQMLEMYLNLVYFGQGARGTSSASKVYFNASPDHLDLAQAALLTGLVQAPGLYNSWCHPTLARAHQLAMLNQMAADRYISRTKRAGAEREVFAF